MLLKLENIGKSYERPVLKNINIEIEEGELVSIIGPSGAGKSTLLKIINNLEVCDSGRMEIQGSLAMENSRVKDPQAFKNLGLVFQNYNLFPHLKVRDNISLALKKTRGLDSKKADQIALKCLETFGIEDRKDLYPLSLSGGEKQRVALCRTLVLEPSLICLDEPTSALDPESKLRIEQIILDLKDEGRTILVISHDMELAKKISDRIYFMDRGQIRASYKKGELMEIEDERIRNFIKG